eukprot:CAMPEP_0197068656 /NCGR_PEP_ID=MMETSP1384-20130603/188271_1 /TAXON_ID=29189 /ORGANISM="Ammonia sp." /LENGTH=178 /DNA_ID=CAMNT_0042506447 /DNA_START=1 /DNA_END=537 /DNA_ORIENTATION=+
MGGGMSAAEVNKTVDRESGTKSSYLKREYYQIVIDRTYDFNDYPKEICGSIISVIEESFPFNEKNNVKWLVQQIVHLVCAARTGTNPNIQIYRGTQFTSINGEKLKMKVDSYSFVYGVGGEWLSAGNIDKMKVRFVVGFRHTADSQSSMSPTTVAILEAKDAPGQNAVEKSTFKDIVM